MAGKFYTLEEVRDLVEFCKQRQVMLIPEIDMPGHSAAFVRAFRHDMQSEAGMKILKIGELYLANRCHQVCYAKV